MAPRRDNAAAKPVSEAARRLDFYLPPPDDRAYRRGKIQRLRDQITAWRRQPRQGDIQAFVRTASARGEQGEAAVDMPLWKASTVSPTRRSASRHEKVLMLSRVTPGPPNGRNTFAPATQGGCLQETTPPRSSNYTNMNNCGHTTQIVGGVTEVPYFHDHTVFCLPKDRRAAMAAAAAAGAASADSPGAVDDSEAPQTEPGVGFCYGVTSNSEEMARHSEQLGLAGKADRDGAVLPEKTTISGDSLEGASSLFFSSLLPNGKRAVSVSRSAAQKGLTIGSSFAAMTRSVELAMAVHTEWTHRRSVMRRSRSDSVCQRVLEQTMEIPIDWREFERVSPGGGNASCLAMPSDEPCSAASVGRTPCTVPSGTGSGGRGPMRLYNIRMRKRVANSEGSMEKASSFPRLGTRVILSKSWV